MLIFIQRSSSEAFRYEELYAKKIGLMLNRVESESYLEINVTDLIKNSEKNIKNEDFLEFVQKEMIKIDTERSLVEIKTKKEGGFSYPFFSKIEIDRNLTKINLELNKENRIIGGKIIIWIK